MELEAGAYLEDLGDVTLFQFLREQAGDNVAPGVVEAYRCGDLPLPDRNLRA
jgi:hypothetical protein